MKTLSKLRLLFVFGATMALQQAACSSQDAAQSGSPESVGEVSSAAGGGTSGGTSGGGGTDAAVDAQLPYCADPTYKDPCADGGADSGTDSGSCRAHECVYHAKPISTLLCCGLVQACVADPGNGDAAPPGVPQPSCKPDYGYYQDKASGGDGGADAGGCQAAGGWESANQDKDPIVCTDYEDTSEGGTSTACLYKPPVKTKPNSTLPDGGSPEKWDNSRYASCGLANPMNAKPCGVFPPRDTMCISEQNLYYRAINTWILAKDTLRIEQGILANENAVLHALQGHCRPQFDVRLAQHGFKGHGRPRPQDCQSGRHRRQSTV